MLDKKKRKIIQMLLIPAILLLAGAAILALLYVSGNYMQVPPIAIGAMAVLGVILFVIGDRLKKSA